MLKTTCTRERTMSQWRFCLSLVVILLTLFWAGLTPGPGRGVARASTPSQSVPKPQQAQGQWSTPLTIDVVGIHAALLNNGLVLFWWYGGSGYPSPAELWNPVTNALTMVTLPFTADIFCSGTTLQPDGRLLVSGGKDDTTPGKPYGITNATIFDPSIDNWYSVAPMNYARWYPTGLTLPNGNTLVLSGENATGLEVLQMEEYNEGANTWTVLPASANIPLATLPYPHTALLTTGNVFMQTVGTATYQFNPTTNVWTAGPSMNLYRHYDGLVLLPGLQQVLVAGGRQVMEDSGLATNTAEMIDFSQPNPQWTYVAPMNYPRENLNLVMLPDGTVLAVGGGQGSTSSVRPTYANPVFAAELFNPTSGTWTVMASQQVQRTYHSTALLLPDGRVVSAGSDYGEQEKTLEVYSPPYLFNGTRPTITSSPASVGYNQQFCIVTPNAANITQVALVKAESTTHTNRFDERYVSLSFTIGNGQITATSPLNGNYAPPGYYLLSIVNSSGVPAVMPFIQVTSN
jgi:hypothetical protein